ncbi:ABC transporter, ATP-binding protein [Marvinbryantia formatexigens DSM 14469]|uniref:ABC transporter, ATP-binding protein n=1 Tax=Marvinbryantia formatexigens DSM 14469 TaxID=478749 RepID=C6LF41_9FIRM|nr:ATP-binding cassette domain-containing protein [Marvinbryantia formatexigens]EET60781.1 ABC transporter, ATP-binding protein [Marvinbryantia formatexigens DSM 14469]UWO26876.1 ATP-binding cassette domain-containing protein [Marvinbryantia formatexigens DSM 14469]SDG32797.1 putative ABC transport system permease protein [Marvinbryantia formatexigens]
MLELKNIKKDYPAGNETVHALKGISLQFRENEFVSILGPSGCGKTTMLNIIGGLDKYTDGDLIINGRSTKSYKDRDWDTYRNHSIGFVFQSYNLIPHQTVLQNVELALTLSGVSKSERRERAKKALEEVGLGNQLRKKPSEMSGGQMQRVAIARALVNNPDIILADEPTGALDTETSVQVMEILKKVASDRLVIMVTHNPELAMRYSTRIIRMLDGNITDDSAPLTKEEVAAETKKQAEKADGGKTKKKHRKPSMSMGTAFSLSLKNLFTKKGRTMLTSFAGSIGIIGIALIYAVSQGMTTYIDTLQEDTLSSYPLTIEAQHLDTGSLLETFIGSATSGGEHENDAVYEKGMLYKMINSLNTMETDENDLKAFKEYIETERAKGDDGSGDGETSLAEALSGVQYTYDMDMQIYTESVDGTIIQSDTQELLQELMLEYFGLDMSSMTSLGDSYGMSDMMESMSGMSGMSGTSAVLWQEMLPGNDGELISPLLEKQYDVIYGSWPSAYNEVVLVVDENNEIDDMTLYALGLKSKDDIDELAQAAIDQTEIAEPEEKWTYEDICNMEFRTIFASDCYTYDEQTGLYTDLRDSQAGMKYLYDNGVPLKVSGIIRPNEDSVSSMLSGTIGYTSALTEYVIENAKGSEAVNAQLADPSTDIFTGLPFSENTGNLTDEEKAQEFEDYIAQLDEEGKAGAYVEMMSIPSEEELEGMVTDAVGSKTRADIESDMTQALVQQMGMAENEVADYLADMSDEDLNDLYTQMVEEQVKAQYAQQVSEELGSMDTAQLAAALDAAMPEYSTQQLAVYHDEILEFSDSSYENNLRELGVVDIDSPSSINLYASTFENKDVIEDAIDAYNEGADELEQITYTDYVGLMMSSVTAIINAITYVLIAFVAISLIVSSIMIGVITLISVQERTKEIGILRAIGASKKNVSHMFNAETVIIGFASGTLGVIITDLLCIPVNALLHHLTGINNLNAYLPWQVALILIGISVLLTLISGIIPSRSAAKKDPVVALRSE